MIWWIERLWIGWFGLGALLWPGMSYASVGVVDLLEKTAEIRFAAVLGNVAAVSDDSIQLRVCADPKQSLIKGCPDSKLISPPLAAEIWRARLKKHLGLDGRVEDQREQIDRNDVIAWSRKILRGKIERTGNSKLKESGENLLDTLMDAADPTARAERLALAQEVFTTLFELLPSKRVETEEVYFRNVEPALYEAALAPFAQWMAKMVCRCELSIGEGESDEPSCVLKKGVTTLARTLSAAPSECASRSSCSSRVWLADAPTKKELDFDNLIDTECGGFYSVGAVASWFGEGNEKTGE